MKNNSVKETEISIYEIFQCRITPLKHFVDVVTFLLHIIITRDEAYPDPEIGTMLPVENITRDQSTPTQNYVLSNSATFHSLKLRRYARHYFRFKDDVKYSTTFVSAWLQLIYMKMYSKNNEYGL